MGSGSQVGAWAIGGPRVWVLVGRAVFVSFATCSVDARLMFVRCPFGVRLMFFRLLLDVRWILVESVEASGLSACRGSEPATWMSVGCPLDVRWMSVGSHTAALVYDKGGGLDSPAGDDPRPPVVLGSLCCYSGVISRSLWDYFWYIRVTLEPYLSQVDIEKP